jgi:hypothetical protein
MLGAIIRRYWPFPNFLKVRGDLLLEEIHLDTSGMVAASTTFYSNNTSLAPLQPPLTSPHPPGKNNGSSPGTGNGNGSNNNWNKNNNRHNGGKNSNNSGNCGGNTSSNITAVSNGATTNDGRGPPTWSTYMNPWQRHISMCPSPTPTDQQCPQAFMAGPGPYTPSGFALVQQQLYQQSTLAPPPG